MKIKHHDPIIKADSPFGNCKLNREKYARILTTIVTTYGDGFVLAINNEWGTGKTTFVRMWEQQLKNDGFQTLYFNAWENDFGTNPLAALIAEFQPLVKKSNEKKFRAIIEKGAIITKKTLPKIAKALASKYVDVEGIIDAIEGATQGIADILEEEVKDYANRKDGLREFRQSITSFVQETKGDKPLIFIIDELDRCRPNYSVELLEQIKHFFSVPGIVFVLSIDKTQLGNAVRGVYGSDLINADEYLRRFIDVEYSIPEPSTKEFCKYLYEYFNFDSFFFSDVRRSYPELRNDRRVFIDVASALFKKSNLSLRQQEKIFVHARLGCSSFRENEYVFPGLYLMLIFLKSFNPDFYIKLQQRKLGLDNLTSEFHKLLPEGIHEDDREYFIYIEAMLVFMYNNFLAVRPRKELINKDVQTGLETSIIQSKIDPSSEQSSFIGYLKAFIGNWDFSTVGIEYLTKKIDLIEEVIQ